MKKIILSLAAAICFCSTFTYAQTTTNILGGGVCINEILIDPNSATNNFDTDRDGIAETTDEFVELYNTSTTSVDISGWELWDAGNGKWFTFPANTILGPDDYAVVVANSAGGILPTIGEGDFAFNAGGNGVMNNSKDNVVLYNPNSNKYIQLLYNNDTQDNPSATYAGFSATATLIGTIENWGSDLDGTSLTRNPSGDANIVRHNSINALLATPGKIPCGITVSIAKTNTNCFGNTDGSAIATVMGGTNYTYAWSTGSSTNKESNLGAGNYSLTVIADATCTVTESYTITEPTQITVTTTSTPENCKNNGTTTAVATGGNGGYNYQWGTQNGSTANGLAAGTYFVNVNDSKGCFGGKSATVTANILSVTVTATNATCGGSDGTTQVTISGGVSPFNFLWNTSATTANLTGLISGIYTANVSAADGCIVGESGAVNEIGGPNITVTTTNMICNNQSNGTATAIVASGGITPYTYNWMELNSSTPLGNMPMITGLGTGTYSVTITDAQNPGCKTFGNGNVTNPPLFNISTGVNNVTTNGASDGSAFVNIMNGNGPFSYIWSNSSTTNFISGLPAATYTVTATDGGGCTIIDNAIVNEPPLCIMTIAMNKQDDLCGNNGGFATANLTGGTAPFSYFWTSGSNAQTAVNLGAGIYSVNVTDFFGCTKNQSVTITSLPPLSTTTTSTAATCGANDATAGVATLGGTAPYTYSWSNNTTTVLLTGLSAGFYDVTVTDTNNCKSLNSVNVVNPGAPTATLLATDVSCPTSSDGSITTTVAGGTTPYTYLWENNLGNIIGTTASITGLSGGTYLVTISDTQNPTCATSTSQIVNEATPILPNISVQNASCSNISDGGLTSFPNGGTIGSGYSYVWDNGAITNFISNLPVSTPTVTVTDGVGCTAIATASVLSNSPPLTVTLNKIDDTCGNNTGSITANVSGGTPAYNYNWSNFGFGQTISNLSSGTSYSVTVVDNTGCQMVSSVVTITGATAPLLTTITATTANCGASNGTATLVAAGGTTPYLYLWNNGATTTSVSGLAAGAALVTITDALGCNQGDGALINNPGGPSVTVTTNNVTCIGDANGSANSMATGGTTPYTYTWSNLAGTLIGTTASLTGLTADTYILTVTDAQNPACSAVDGGDVLAPAPIAISLGFTAPPNCFGKSDGSTNLTVTSGQPPYTYLWDNGDVTDFSFNLHGGTNVVTVTENTGCFKAFNITLSEPSQITVTTTTIDALCGTPTGSANAVASGGSGGFFNYVWSNGQNSNMVNNLFAGNYFVTATDGFGCTGIGAATINNANGPSVTVTADTIPCGGVGLALATVSGGLTPYTYLWSNNGGTSSSVSTLVAQLLEVTVTDANSCTATSFVNVYKAPPFSHTITFTNPTTIGGADGSAIVTVTGGIPPYSYVWSNGSTGNTISGVPAGTYRVTVTDMTGNTTPSSCSPVWFLTITDPACTLTITTSSTNVLCNGGNGSSIVSGTGGVLPYTYLWDNGSTTNSTGAVGANNYVVSVTDAVGCIKSVTTTITEPTAFSIGASDVNVSCFGGSNGTAAASPSGGVSPYTYLWDNGATTQNLSNLVAATYCVTVTDANGCTDNRCRTVTEPLVLTSSATSTNVLCNGNSTGTATVSTTGGTSPYTYLWNNTQNTMTATGLVAGSYSVTVTDANSCVGLSSGTINEPLALSLTIITTNISCNGLLDGTATATASGGTTPYLYNWSNGATGPIAIGCAPLVPNVLSVTDANGCSIIYSVTLSEPTAITVTAAQSNVNCNGGSDGSVQLAVSGGTTGYTYLWSDNNTTNMNSGNSVTTLNVTISDANSCTDISSYTITEPVALAASISVTQSACAGTTGSATAFGINGGTSPYAYLWNDNQTTTTATGLAAGSYTVTISDNNGCNITLNDAVINPNSPTVAVNTTDVNCNAGSDGTATSVVSGGTSPYNYLWTGSETTSSISNLIAGNYSITITDANSCVGLASGTITEPTALSITMTSTNVSCNGLSNGSVSTTLNGGVTNYTYLWSNGITTATITGIAANTYTITVTDSNNCTINGVITITQPSAITASATQTNISCNGANDGSVQLSVTGGVTGYTYLWSDNNTTNANSGNGATTLTITITDANSCTDMSSYTITEPMALSITTSNTNISCNGANDGTVLASISGGPTTNYSYVWQNGATTNPLTGMAPGAKSVTVTSGTCSITTTSAVLTEPTVLTATANLIANASCHGDSNGSATVATAGGTTPYSYLWSNAATTDTIANLTANTYAITLTDNNNCTAMSSITINEPPALTVTASTASNVSCNGLSDGAAFVSAFGVFITDYIWDNSETTATAVSLSAGIHNVTVSSSVCTAVTAVTITEPMALSITSTSTAPTCNGGANGTATTSISGGTTAYSYFWNNNQTTRIATGLTVGTYSVTATDANGCWIPSTITVTEPLAIIGAITTTNATCGGSDGVATVSTINGTTPYTYVWNNAQTTAAATGLLAAFYTVTITDVDGCTVTTSANVNNAGAPTVSVSVTTNVLCNGGNDGAIIATVTGGTSPFTFAWDDTATQTTNPATGLTAGLYSILVTDASGCIGGANTNITEPAVLTATVSSNNISCNSLSNGTAMLTTIGGTTPYSYLWTNNSSTAGINGLSVGTYLVTVNDANNCVTNNSVTITEPTAITVTANQTNVSCNGGSDDKLKLTTTGGTAPYAYIWSNGITSNFNASNGAGLQSATVTDTNGCTNVSSYTITEPTAISITTASTDAACAVADGTASVTVTGGTSPYTYLWSNSQTTTTNTGIAAGTYTPTITDANSCNQTVAITVSNPNTPTVSVSVTNVNCNGNSDGMLQTVITGGTSPFTYLWDNSSTTATLTGLAIGSGAITVTDALACVGTASGTITEPTALSITVTPTNSSCNGLSDGAAMASLSGGTTAYSYIWSNGATNGTVSGLSAGSYGITVTDANGCTINSNTTLTEPTAITLTVSTTTNTSCNGTADGIAMATATGGASTSYTYSWGNSETTAAATGLTAGVHNVTVSAMTCSQIATVTITEPTLITITTTVTDISCNGAVNGMVNTTVAGGAVSSYTYLWNNNATTGNVTGLSIGTITVTVTAGACFATTIVTISEPAAITTTITSTDANCNGNASGTSSVTVNGGTTPYAYSWSNGNNSNATTGLSTGAITVTITDANSCTNTVSDVINEPTAITVSTTATDATSGTNADGDATVTATGGTTPYAYSWSNGSATATATGLVTNTYTVTVTDANGCSANASQLVDFTSSINEIANNFSFETYPNPNKGSFIVEMTKGGKYTISIKDVLGKTVYQQNTNGINRKEINIESVDSGVYFLTVKGVGFERTQRIVINK